MSTQILEDARARMISQQVRTWSVLDPVVLAALAAVPREDFVPARFRAVAFADTGIPLPHGQTMMSPQVEGRLLQALEIQKNDQVLEIGTGSGFLTACLARLAGSIDSLELFPDLAAAATEKLANLPLTGRCQVLNRDVFDFRPDKPYDVVVFTGSLLQWQTEFQHWLAPDGRLFVITGSAPIMAAQLIRRTGSSRQWTSEVLFETVIPPLCNLPAATTFTL